MSRREPIFNAPAPIVTALAVLVAVHAGRYLLSEENDAWLVLALAFIPARYSGLAEQLPGGEFSAVTSWVTHMLVHGDVVHLMINGAWLLVFGTVLVRRIGGAACVILGLVSGLLGALTFLAINPALIAPMVGASGAVSGLMGGTFRFLFPALDRGGLAVLRTSPESVRRMGLGEMLVDRRVLAVVAILIALNFLAALGIGGPASAGAIAWEAHLGGFFAGLLGFGWFDRHQASA